MRTDPLLFIISSPSGAGKTTLTQRMMPHFPDLTFSVSHTTRKPRANEVNGQDYWFTNADDFRAMIAEDRFAEWAEVHGNFYGTSVSEIDRAKREGKSGILFDVDYQGARQIKAKFPEAIGIFILPPSFEELERRLRGRASDDEAAIQRRFAKAKEEIEHYPFFDYMVQNDDLQRALSELEGIVYAERCKRHRMAPIAESLLRTLR